MSVIIAGSRNLVITTEELESIINESGLCIKTLINGGYHTGIDAVAREYAKLHNIRTEIYSANWNDHGPAAGPIRNRLMASKAEALIAVYRERTPGTQNMILEAKKRKLRVFVKVLK